MNLRLCGFEEIGISVKYYTKLALMEDFKLHLWDELHLASGEVPMADIEGMEKVELEMLKYALNSVLTNG